MAQQLRLAGGTGQPAVAPAHQLHDHREPIAAHVRQPVLPAFRARLVQAAAKDPQFRQPGQPVGQDVGRDPERVPELVEFAQPVEGTGVDVGVRPGACLQRVRYNGVSRRGPRRRPTFQPPTPLREP